MAQILTSLHGNLLGLDVNGNLVDKNGNLIGNRIQTEGKTIYVSSVTGSATANGLSPDQAVTTLALATGIATANQGDVVVFLPNHAQTITGVAGIAFSKAGVTYLGLGTYNQRPRFLMDGGTTVTAVISAADVVLNNLVFAAGHSGVVAGIDVTAVGAQILNCEFENNTTNENFLTPIKATGTTSAEADGLTVQGCQWITSDADDLEFIELNADTARVTIADNYVNSAGTASPLLLVAGTKILTGAKILRNIIQNANTANDLLIDNGGSTGQTGIVAYNLIGNLDTTGAQLGGAATGLQFFENYYTSTSTDSGAIAPAADTPLT